MAATDSFYLGQRLSYGRAMCTVRYIGGVDGTPGDWIGVEWDNSLRGKHDGVHEGKRYFSCRLPNAGSFVRPTRAPDPALTFLEALRKKYTTDHDPEIVHFAISLSTNKVVEEVGFDKIRRKLAQLRELRVVLLDGMGIWGCAEEVEEVARTCPNIEELDLSRNRFESLQQVAKICSALPKLRQLRLNGNRFLTVDLDAPPPAAFANVRHLELGNTLLPWPQLRKVSAYFGGVTQLSLSDNLISSLPDGGDGDGDGDGPLFPPTVRILDLSGNRIGRIADVVPVLGRTLPALSYLSLAHNCISSLAPPSTATATATATTSLPSLHRLDLSYNHLRDFPELDHLPHITPNLRNLRISHNTMFNGLKLEDAFMLTVARLARGVEVLNHSAVTMKEREDAELWYLGKVARELVEAEEKAEEEGEGEEGKRRRREEVLSRNRRWDELCQLHGTPTATSSALAGTGTNILSSNLLQLEFTLSTDPQNATPPSSPPAAPKTKSIPKSIPVSTLRRLVARWFNLSGDTAALNLVLKCHVGGGSGGGEGEGDEADEKVVGGEEDLVYGDAEVGDIAAGKKEAEEGDGEDVVVLRDVDDTREIGIVLEDLKGVGRVVVEVA